VFWPRIVLKKLLNINSKVSDFNADPDEAVSDSESENECTSFESIPRMRRRNSETIRAQYINTKELRLRFCPNFSTHRVCAGTWNVGGKLPPDDLNIEDWLNLDEPADIYVLGFQEIVPLNAGNIFGAEDSRPVPKWENIIRETLNRVQPINKFKCYSVPPSPSRFQPSEEFPDIEDEILHETDSDSDEEEIHPSYDEIHFFDEVKVVPVKTENGFSENASIQTVKEIDLHRQFTSPKKLDRLNCLRMAEDCTEESESIVPQQIRKLTKTYSGADRIGLSWPEPPLNLIAQHDLEQPKSYRSVKSFKTSKSFKTYTSFKLSTNGDSSCFDHKASLKETNLESIMYQKRRSPFVKIVSKQMVGIFLSVWVRRSLRRHIQNLKVSSVGVGLMGYIGNKGSISVSMSIYQTLFCFICTHLSSGEKEGDELRRNADVQEIHRRTHFHSVSDIISPQTIHDHERIIWFGDLNYRINLSYEKTKELISKKEWSKLVERDQLVRELRKGRAFDGWTEGTLTFPPTYKYELNSEKYYGEDPKVGRRVPAWYMFKLADVAGKKPAGDFNTCCLLVVKFRSGGSGSGGWAWALFGRAGLAGTDLGRTRAEHELVYFNKRKDESRDGGVRWKVVDGGFNDRSAFCRAPGVGGQPRPRGENVGSARFKGGVVCGLLGTREGARGLVPRGHYQWSREGDLENFLALSQRVEEVAWLVGRV
ncbi:hypothetical protein GIB67_020458, partial [Kingdonia uniflora]